MLLNQQNEIKLNNLNQKVVANVVRKGKVSVIKQAKQQKMIKSFNYTRPSVKKEFNQRP